MDEGMVNLLSVMDHSPGQGQFKTLDAYLEYMMGNHGMSREQAEEAARAKAAAQEGAVGRVEHLLERARLYGIPTASHDDDSVHRIAAMRALGVAMSEFPHHPGYSQGRRYRAACPPSRARPTCCAARSQSGSMRAIDAIRAGVASCLCSDYQPSTLIAAAFVAARQASLSLPQAIALVSANPAKAAGLDDRGRIQAGLRADLTAVATVGGQALVSRPYLESAGRLVFSAGYPVLPESAALQQSNAPRRRRRGAARQARSTAPAARRGGTCRHDGHNGVSVPETLMPTVSSTPAPCLRHTASAQRFSSFMLSRPGAGLPPKLPGPARGSAIARPRMARMPILLRPRFFALPDRSSAEPAVSCGIAGNIACRMPSRSSGKFNQFFASRFELAHFDTHAHLLDSVGKRALDNICDMIRDERIALDTKRSVIHDLSRGLNVCASGTTANLIAADRDLALSSEGIRPALWKVKHDITHDILLRAVSTEYAQVRHYTGNEIHYFNSAWNYVATSVGLSEIPDLMARNLPHAFLEHCRNEVHAAMTPVGLARVMAKQCLEIFTSGLAARKMAPSGTYTAGTHEAFTELLCGGAPAVSAGPGHAAPAYFRGA